MSPHRFTPSPAHVVAALIVAAGVTILAPSAQALELRLTTGNDLLRGSSTKDDLYTFSVGLEVERGGIVVARVAVLVGVETERTSRFAGACAARMTACLYPSVRCATAFASRARR